MTSEEKKEKARAYQRRWRAANRDKYRASAKRYKERHPERVKAVRRAWVAKNKDKMRGHRRKHKSKPEVKNREAARARLKHTGWTAAQFEAAWEGQAGRCAICAKPMKIGGWDHDSVSADHVDLPDGMKHQRALLCGFCNRALGLFGDDPSRLRAAADYVERHGRVERWSSF